MKNKNARSLVWTRPISPRWADAWIERIAFVGNDRVMVVEKPGIRLAMLEAYPATSQVGKKLVSHFGGRLRSISATSWIKKGGPAKPIHFGKSLIVVSEPMKAKDKSETPTLCIPAGLAFGTGQHETTAMLLHELTTLDGWPEKRFLDAGTGSGILALVARALGAKRVEAFDFDPIALRTAKENERNNFKKSTIAWSERDFMRWKPARAAYDVLCANLFSELLINRASILADSLKPGGTLLVSGILNTQVKTVDRALKATGLKLNFWKQRKKWSMARWEKA